MSTDDLVLQDLQAEMNRDSEIILGLASEINRFLSAVGRPDMENVKILALHEIIPLLVTRAKKERNEEISAGYGLVLYFLLQLKLEATEFLCNYIKENHNAVPNN